MSDEEHTCEFCPKVPELEYLESISRFLGLIELMNSPDHEAAKLIWTSATPLDYLLSVITYVDMLNELAVLGLDPVRTIERFRAHVNARLANCS